MPETNVDLQEEVTEEPVRDTKATVTISRVDRSIKNSEGEVLIEHFYDQVFVTGNFEGTAKINATLVADMTEFFNLHTDLQEMVPYIDRNHGGFFSTRAAEVTHNEGSLLCIEYASEWCMGGVHNGDIYPFVFDLNTGETPSLSSLTGVDSDKLESALKIIIKDYLYSDYYGEGVGYIDDYSLDDFNYTIRDGKICIVFETYEIACGAAGSIIVPTDFYAVSMQ